MEFRHRWLSLNLLLALLATPVAASESDWLPGTVFKVSDGDTLQFRPEWKDQREKADRKPWRIRLVGIDAPEKSQPFGGRCRDLLNEWISEVSGRRLELKVRAIDRYGRRLGLIRLPGTERTLNLKMIESGCAWHYKSYAKTQPPEERRSFAAAEDRARELKMGLWIDPSSEPPWDYRRAKRAQSRLRRIAREK